jgi:hypothetical protein
MGDIVRQSKNPVVEVVAQPFIVVVIEHLPSMHETLSSIPSITKYIYIYVIYIHYRLYFLYITY